MTDKTRRLIERLRTGQTFHCPYCGFGFPVQDPTTADTVEKLLAVYEAAGEYLYDTSKRQGLQDAYIAVQPEQEQK